jgi:hypothetical protein
VAAFLIIRSRQTVSICTSDVTVKPRLAGRPAPSTENSVLLPLPIAALVYGSILAVRAPLAGRLTARDADRLVAL